MPSILTRENLDLVALKLDRADVAEQVTGLDLLQYFDSIDGFWRACVKMVTPTAMELSNLHKDDEKVTKSKTGSLEQVIEIGIRDQLGDLTASFCNWFDKHCCFVAETSTRNFLLPHLRPAEFAELRSNSSEYQDRSIGERPIRQLHTKFLQTVIENLTIRGTRSAAEIYSEVAQRAVELADDEEWGQNLQARIELGTGRLVVTYTSKGNSSLVSKSISEASVRRILRLNKQQN